MLKIACYTPIALGCAILIDLARQARTAPHVNFDGDQLLMLWLGLLIVFVVADSATQRLAQTQKPRQPINVMDFFEEV